MARSTFRKQITTYNFRTTGDGFTGSLPPIGLMVNEGPFALSDYFEVDEAEQLRDELAAAIEDVKARAVKAEEDAEEGRSLAALDAEKAAVQS